MTMTTMIKKNSNQLHLITRLMRWQLAVVRYVEVSSGTDEKNPTRWFWKIFSSKYFLATSTHGKQSIKHLWKNLAMQRKRRKLMTSKICMNFQLSLHTFPNVTYYVNINYQQLHNKSIYYNYIYILHHNYILYIYISWLVHVFNHTFLLYSNTERHHKSHPDLLPGAEPGSHLCGEADGITASCLTMTRTWHVYHVWQMCGT